MRAINALAPLTTALIALLGCEPSVDLQEAQIGDLASDSERVCVPPQPRSAHSLYIVGPESVLLTGTLNDESGQAILRGGVDVALWLLEQDTLRLGRELAVTKTGEDGSFSLPLDSTDIATFAADNATLTAGLGFVIDGQYERWLSPKVQAAYDAPAQVTCAYWADSNGHPIGNAALGDSVQLVVRAIGEPPEGTRLTVREVGNDLSGDDIVAEMMAEPFINGVSATSWVANADEGFLDGNGLELQFSATASDAGYAFGYGSEWLFL